MLKRFFGKWKKLTLTPKFEILTKICKTIIFYTKPALKYRTRVILTISNLILKNQIRLS